MPEFAARKDALMFLIAHVESHCADLGLPEEVAQRAGLILEELFLNALDHGGASQATDVAVQVELQFAEGELEIFFEDGGVAYDPFSRLDEAPHLLPLRDRPIGRLGLVLVDGLSRRREYQRVGNRNQVRIWLSA